MENQSTNTVSTQSYSGPSGPSEAEGAPPEGFSEGGYLPCENTSCKSYGKPHPNCRCHQPNFAEGGQVESHCSGQNAHKPECTYYEHPQETVDGAVAHHGLLHLLTKTGRTKSEEPHRSMHDHKEASIKGRKSHHGHVETLFEKGKNIKAERSGLALRDHLEKLELDPESMLELGGDMSPEHSAQIASLASNAMEYMKSLKPNQVRNAPLDELSPVDKMDEAKYHRQLEIAENPSMILANVKDGTLRPSDIMTVSTLYPKLYESMKSKANDTLITAIAEDKEISYKQRQSLSLLLGMPLDYTQTPQAAQAIMASQAEQQMQQQAKKQPKSSKANSTEMKQINKVTDLSETSLESRIQRKNKS